LEGMVTRLEWMDGTLPQGLLVLTLVVTVGIDNDEGDLRIDMNVISQITKFILKFSKMVMKALIITLSVILYAM
jgi:hypothetical protein